MNNLEKKITKIKNMCIGMRKNILDMAINAGTESSHFGGGLSIVEITATLYGEIMNYKINEPEWKGRDKFILSKGHGVLGLYSALAEVGIINKLDLYGHFVLFHKILFFLLFLIN